MNTKWRALVLVSMLCLCQSEALGWHDTGHMVVAQIAYLRLTPAAKKEVDRLLIAPPDRRGLIFYCDKTYDPVTIAVWMDDIKGDSLTDEYAPWHYTNYKPFFDGIPVRTDVGPEPLNVLDRLNWTISTLRKGTGRDKSDAETLGFLYHLIGDVHQPLHTSTRYTAAHPEGDAGGNLFLLRMPQETRIRNLHSFWDAAGGMFGFGSTPRDAAGLTRIRNFANQIMRDHPPSADAAWKELEPFRWVEESNTIARAKAYTGIKDGDAPSKTYTDETQRVSARRIALAGYRLAELLNGIYTGTRKN